MPLEVLRTIHSFDPCMACGVHLLDVDGNEINQVSVDAADHFSNPLVRMRGKPKTEESGPACACRQPVRRRPPRIARVSRSDG